MSSLFIKQQQKHQEEEDKNNDDDDVEVTVESSNTRKTNVFDDGDNCLKEHLNKLTSLNDSLYLNKYITIVPIDKEAPSSDCWYHGRLDRFFSEDRLRKSGKIRCFLVRESFSRPGNYVLSYFALDGTFNHYKITAVFGDYYIGGRQFDRLETLVSYYMYYSELKRGETLLNPVSPPQICKLERNCIAIKNHEKLTDSDEISYLKGDFIKLYHRIGESPWFWSQLLRTKECGFVNINSVKDVENERLHEFEPWYFDSISKEEAGTILTNAGQYSFLVRPSETSPGNFTLYFYVDNTIHRYRIIQIGKQFHIGGRPFDSISDIIERYKHEDLMDGGRRLVDWNYQNYELKRQFSNNNSNSQDDDEDDEVENEEDDEEDDDDEIEADDDADDIEIDVDDDDDDVELKNVEEQDENEEILDVDNSIEHIEDIKINNECTDDSMVTTPPPLTTTTITKNTDEDLYITVDVQSSVIATSIILTNNSLLQQSSSSSPFVSTMTSSSSISKNDDIDINEFNTNRKRNSIGPDIFTRRSDQVTIKGYLNKYNEKTKKWKPYWFVLNSTERQLFYFANEKRIKEKGLIDLCYGLYYPVDISLFNKLYCFQITIRSFANNCPITYYLAAENESLFKEWTIKIRLLCDPIQLNKKIEIKSTTTMLSLLNSTIPRLDQSLLTSSLNESLIIKQQQKQQLNYFIERFLYIEIKEARNLAALITTSLLHTSNNNRTGTLSQLITSDENSSSSNNSNTSNHHLPLSKQQSAPVDDISSTIIQQEQTQIYKNYYFYCLVLVNNDILVAKTKQLQNHNQLKISSSDLIWNEKFTYENIPIDITSLKLLIFATKNFNLTIDSIFNSLHTPSSTSTSGFSSTTSSLTNTTALLSLLKFRNSNNILIGELNLKLSDYLNKGLEENWYKIDGVISSGNSKISKITTTTTTLTNSQIRLKIRYNEEKILFNLVDYYKLQSYLTKSIAELSIIYDCICPTSERSELVLNLIKFYINQSQTPQILQSTSIKLNQHINETELRLLDTLKLFLNYEIERCVDLNTLFRSTTLTTSLMDYYMRSKTTQYLQKCLYEPLIKILKQTKRQQKSFELDPLKLQTQYSQQNLLQAQLNLNLQHFKQSFTVLLKSICQQTLAHFPIELIYLFQYIRKQVIAKWSTTATLKYARVYCISSFLFLRLICPSLMNLTVNSTVACTNTDTNVIDTGNYLNERYILLITKALQRLANLTECKETYMQPLSEYLNENKVYMIKFIDFISNFDDIVNTGSNSKEKSLPPAPPPASITQDSSLIIDNRLNLCKNLAYLHRLLQSFSTQIRLHALNTSIENDDDEKKLKQKQNNNENLLTLVEVLNEINVKINNS